MTPSNTINTIRTTSQYHNRRADEQLIKKSIPEEEVFAVSFGSAAEALSVPVCVLAPFSVPKMSLQKLIPSSWFRRHQQSHTVQIELQTEW